jgi:hypothetical protein
MPDASLIAIATPLIRRQPPADISYASAAAFDTLLRFSIRRHFTLLIAEPLF